jgi:tetratricopeptide (TPR) repeat protein
MRLLILSIVFLLACHSPLWAAKNVYLNELSKKNQIGFTRLTLDFSSLPSCQVKTYGQRIDLRFRGVDLGPKFRELPEDDSIVRVILAKGKEDLVLSFLFRKLPLKVETTPVASKDQLFVDIFWKKKKTRSVRLAVDTRSKGLPKKKGVGSASISREKSDYSENWEKFFHDYQAPLQIKAPVRFSLPELPLISERLVSEDIREVWKVALTEGWNTVEPLLEMQAKNNKDFEESDVYKAVLMEAMVRSGKYKAALAGAFEPQESSLYERCQYLKNFSRASLSEHFLARNEVKSALKGMKKDNSFQPYFLLLQAEIALALDAPKEALECLSRKDVAWTGDLEKIRKLRLIDSKGFENVDVATPPSITKNIEDKSLPPETVAVKDGDSWWSLSRQHGVSVADLKKRNNISGNILQIGQMLVVSPHKDLPVPEKKTVEKTPSPKKLRNPYTPYLKDHDLFFKKPFSLCRAADLFQKQQRFNEALFLYEKAKLALEDSTVKTLVDFSTARLLKKVGKTDMALERLEGLIERDSNAEAGCRARLALLEDKALENQWLEYLKMADEYGDVAQRARPRELRETAAFKQALALYFGGEKEKSIHSFDKFRKNFAAGVLAKEAECFLREKLPSLIEEIAGKGRDFDAVLLLDGHRKILLSLQMDSHFLIGLATSLSRLGLMKRAAKIYLFLLENYRDEEGEKFFYQPLVNTYMERQDYSAAADFSGRYIERFPEAEDWQELFYLHLLALQKAERLDEAISAWKKYQHRADSRGRTVAARVFWAKERYQDVIDCLQQGPGESGQFPDDVLILKAESHLKQKQKKEAFALFQELSGKKSFFQQSLYRCAQIAISAGNKNEALNYLNQVVEKGENGFWDDLARTSMTEIKM